MEITMSENPQYYSNITMRPPYHISNHIKTQPLYKTHLSVDHTNGEVLGGGFLEGEHQVLHLRHALHIEHGDLRYIIFSELLT